MDKLPHTLYTTERLRDGDILEIYRCTRTGELVQGDDVLEDDGKEYCPHCETMGEEEEEEK